MQTTTQNVIVLLVLSETSVIQQALAIQIHVSQMVFVESRLTMDMNALVRLEETVLTVSLTIHAIQILVLTMVN